MTRDELRHVAVWFLVTRAIVACAAFAGWAHPNAGYGYHGYGEPPPAALAPFIRWDAQTYYIEMARHGYPPAKVDGLELKAAFFPLYPLTVMALDAVLHETYVSAMLLSNLFAFVAALLIGRLARACGGDGSAASALFLAAPGANFLSIPYSEALFCMLVAGGLLALMKGRPWVAALCGALASATRPTGIVVAVAILWSAFERRRRAGRLMALVLAGLLACGGLVAFAAFCRWRYGDALYFNQVQSVWGRHMTVLGPLKALLGFNFDPDYYIGTLAALAGAIWMIRRSPPVLTAPTWFLLLVPLSTGSLKSMIRFQSANVPLLAAAPEAVRSRGLRIAGLGLSLCLLAYESFMYSAGYGHN